MSKEMEILVMDREFIFRICVGNILVILDTKTKTTYVKNRSFFLYKNYMHIAYLTFLSQNLPQIYTFADAVQICGKFCDNHYTLDDFYFTHHKRTLHIPERICRYMKKF